MSISIGLIKETDDSKRYGCWAKVSKMGERVVSYFGLSSKSDDASSNKGIKVRLGLKLFAAAAIGLMLFGGFPIGNQTMERRSPFERKSLEINPEIHQAMTLKFQNIAQVLQYENVSSLNINPRTSGRTEIDGDGTLYVSVEDYESFRGNGPFTSQELEGKFAHEISHLKLRHLEKRAELEDRLERNLAMQGTKTSFNDDEATAEKVRVERAAVKQEIHAFYRETEKEADLHPVEYSQYLARGVRDAVARPAVGDEMEDPTHPTRNERIQYLTEALCERYPEDNQDICD